MSKRDKRFGAIDRYLRELRPLDLAALELEYAHQEFNPERRAALRQAIAEKQEAAPLIPSEPTVDQWRQLDALLSESRVFAAVSLFVAFTGAPVQSAKVSIGSRFRHLFPHLFASYREVSDSE